MYCGPIHTLGARYCTSCLSPRSRGGFSRNWCVNGLHVRCTCILHPSPPSHMAPGSRPGGLQVYRNWCCLLKNWRNESTLRSKWPRPSPLRGAPCTPHGCRPNEWCVEVGGIHTTCNKRLYEGVVRIGAYMIGILQTQFLQNGGSLQIWP